MTIPRISVVIPCYNQGHYIDDALNSLQNCDAGLFEIIIVNDGSEDDFTRRRLSELESEGYIVINQENKGLSAARNTGIEKAKGDYILPLDADNKIRGDYFFKAIRIMDEDNSVAVVYGNAAFFGEKEGEWIVGDFNLQKLMICNYIDACAIIRKTVLLEQGGYDTKFKNGLEDWEMWLRISFAGYQFRYLNEIVFDYRVVKKSMSNILLRNYQKRNEAIQMIEHKYKKQMGGDYLTEYLAVRFRGNPILFLIKLFLISWFPRTYHYLLRKNKIVKGL